ncbi:GNAT family N-acetyltransferase [Brachyspira hampsonii]|uniref:GNAT family N-acetyltransferase n=1 Tax=Brachyspira hampsonii TaxID=1287055 RepID=A0AAC9TSP7_9SPIR|nr:GNAT family N-acetyltransferase [Brachyspira hampsonii]ASJ22655.1 GNAT family N-acetyltransferase [Brachyspira hampsonii]ELV04558.1 GT family acetyltransferase [Brachyspira hampsonii 30599]MBW5381033.1 GNAT family N-acetyltransferase [Brachyspira hampsonii]MBW5409760.1 GNAT family N-acetyltransferase [Brachyspira hampsonii]OEJ19350.1 acetyltransferase [Brachyspira hampsonii]
MFKIEKAGIENIDDISILAKNIYLKYNSNLDTNEGINNVLTFISANNMKLRFFMQGSLMLIAKNKDDIIVGMLEITDFDHISLFFVDDRYFKLGIASSLFNEAKNILNSDKYTVKSSHYAYEFYKKLGFIELYNDIQEENGVHFHYMIY